MINLCFDNLITDRSDYPWPNLVAAVGRTTDADLYEHRGSFSNTHPRVDFPRIVDYLRDEKIPHTMFLTETAPVGSLYLVNVCWFDHDVDYFSLMPLKSLERLQRREIKFVFIYCESDSGLAIQTTIFKLCARHNVNPLDVHVMLGNSVCNIIPNFHYFNDAEILFKRSQQHNFSEKLSWHDRPRSKKMTMLSRLHKSWRAYFSSWFWQRGYHLNSYFSYRMIDYGDGMDPNSCPLNPTIKHNPVYQKILNEFLDHAPFSADDLTDQVHNQFGSRVDAHYQDSYWNCILETHLSLHQNMPGTLITEKTWKVIAHAQPFIILGTPGSLDHLRNQGYRTFSEIGIDETYDCILDPTERFKCVFDLVEKIQALDWDQLLILNNRAREIVEHNQKLYWDSKRERLINVFLQIQQNNL